MNEVDSGEQLITWMEFLRSSLQGSFWLGYGFFVACCLIFLLGSGLLLKAFLARLVHEPLEKPRWSGSEALVVWVLWALMSLGLGSLMRQILGNPDTPGGTPEVMRIQAGVFLMIVVNLGTSLYALLSLKVAHRQGAEALGLGGGALGRGLVIGPVALFIFFPGCYAILGLWTSLLALNGIILAPQESVVRFAEACQQGQFAQIAMYGTMGVLAAPLFEEILFRGLLTRWLLEKLPSLLAIALSGLIFGLIHLNLQALGPLVVMGMALAWIYSRTGNLWACMIFHALFNGSQFLFLALQNLPRG